MAVWVLACLSRRYFRAALARLRATPILLTRSLMYPGGFLVKALLNGLAVGVSRRVIVRRAAHQYYLNQRRNGTTRRGARSVFWP